MRRLGVLIPATAALLVGCGGGSSSTTAVNPNAQEHSPPGDIPDNQVFVPYKPAGAGFSPVYCQQGALEAQQTRGELGRQAHAAIEARNHFLVAEPEPGSQCGQGKHRPRAQGLKRGFRAFVSAGIKDKIVERYYAGAILLGVSAGAVQLGLKGWDEAGEKTFDTFRLVPFVVDVHDEPSWTGLLRAVPKAGEHARGFGIPAGGGALYHPDYSVEPVRHPLTEVEATESGLRQALLLPGKGGEEEAGEEPRVMSQEEVMERVLRDLGPDSGDPVN